MFHVQKPEMINKTISAYNFKAEEKLRSPE